MSIPSSSLGLVQSNVVEGEDVHSCGKRQTETETHKASTNTSIPKTPNFVLANSVRRRRHTPNLNRPAASPSLNNRISKTYQDAAVELHRTPSAFTQASPNSRRSRIPLIQARSVRFGQLGEAGRSPYSYRSPPKSPDKDLPRPSASSRSQAPVQDLDGPGEPLSSGYAMRVANPEAWNLAYNNNNADDIYGSSPAGPEADATSRVKNNGSPSAPVRSDTVLGETDLAHVGAWLKGLREAEPSEPSPTKDPDPQSSPRPRSVRASSYKENIPPNRTLSPPHPPIAHRTVSTPSRFRITSNYHVSQTPKTPTRFAHPSTPRGLFSVPAHRRRRDAAPHPASTVEQPPQSTSPSTETSANAAITYPSLGPDPAPFLIHEDPDTYVSQSLPPAPPSTPSNPEPTATKNFTISPTHLPSALANLSPAVQIRRSHRKRRDAEKPDKPEKAEKPAQSGRCNKDVSHELGNEDVAGGTGGDIDALAPRTETKRLLRNGKERRAVLSELEVPREKAFVPEAQEAGFEFFA